MSRTGQKQSQLSSLVQSPCKYDIPVELTVSFNQEIAQMSPNRLSSQGSCSDLVQFQPMVTEETSPEVRRNNNNILILSCTSADEADQNVKNLADLLNQQRRNERQKSERVKKQAV